MLRKSDLSEPGRGKIFSSRRTGVNRNYPGDEKEFNEVHDLCLKENGRFILTFQRFVGQKKRHSTYSHTT